MARRFEIIREETGVRPNLKLSFFGAESNGDEQGRRARKRGRNQINAV
jgi:hypothetical protein